MAVKIHNVYSPDQYKRVVELWRRLLNCSCVSTYGQRYDNYLGWLDDEHLYELVLSNGEETENYESVKVSLMSCSNYGGSDYDAANIRWLSENMDWVTTVVDYGPHSESEAYVMLGELPPSAGDDVDERLAQLEYLVKTIEGLENYALIDDEIHTEYVEELATEAWDQWLAWDVKQDLNDWLVGNSGWDLHDFGFSDDEIRDMYYEFTSEQNFGPHCESATSVVFPYHDEVVDLIGKAIIKAWRTPAVDPNQLTLSV
ncbi:hypothetical protein [Nocardia abscessus]|uniref:hypothetical protein n=1 Tax=Nocardia abscessus TaxID=120957 RepID=UPI002454DD01|nr:hypothetical protein [Nocardia abscessus]